ncbi:MAG: SMC-Scp complex subunit ScpB, partial [Edaphobacter sp.]
MSLKAKIEAVIYASEEPVTLAQLVGLLGHEAQAELDDLASAQRSLELDEPADADALNSEILSAIGGAEFEAGTLDHALHVAAAEEAAEAREARHHAAVDAAAMSSAEDAEATAGILAEAVSAEQGTDAAGDSTVEPAEVPAGAAAVQAKDEKQVAREAREKERRLREYFRTIIDQLVADYATSERGLEIREVASGYRLATKPEYHDAVRGFVKSLKPPLKL